MKRRALAPFGVPDLSGTDIRPRAPLPAKAGTPNLKPNTIPRRAFIQSGLLFVPFAPRIIRAATLQHAAALARPQPPKAAAAGGDGSGSQGPNSPGTMTDDSAVGTLTWSNPNNAKVSDDAYAKATSPGGGNSHYLKATNFGFTIPSGTTIVGIKAEIERHGSGSPNSENEDIRVSVVKSDGTVGTENKEILGKWPTTTNTYYTYGGAADLWSETWAYTDINDADFGFVLQAFAANGIECLSPKTIILTTNGGVVIRDLKIGNQVISFDCAKRQKVISMITAIHSRPICNYGNKYFVISSGAHQVFATWNHEFWANGTWKTANELEVGDVLVNDQGIETGIDKILFIENYGDFVWDIAVEPHHNFFANGLLVHNVGGVCNVDHMRMTVYYTTP